MNEEKKSHTCDELEDLKRAETVPPPPDPAPESAALVHQPSVTRSPFVERLLDRALGMAVQVGALKAQVAMLTRGLQAAQAAQSKLAEAQRPAAISVEALAELFAHVRDNPIRAVQIIRAMTGCGVRSAKDIVDSARPAPFTGGSL